MMNSGRRIWTVCMILLAVALVAGIFYYYYHTSRTNTENEGTLIMQSGAEYLWQ
ncbi:MAG: hypothetical protein PHQ72_13320 [Hespellia sp.]|nr:hypothetical protein [Hespellia sp.]